MGGPAWSRSSGWPTWDPHLQGRLARLPAYVLNRPGGLTAGSVSTNSPRDGSRVNIEQPSPKLSTIAQFDPAAGRLPWWTCNLTEDMAAMKPSQVQGWHSIATITGLTIQAVASGDHFFPRLQRQSKVDGSVLQPSEV